MTTRWVAPRTPDFTRCAEEGVSGSCGPGLSSNSGTQASPWSFAKACGASGAQPTDIVNMRGGIYIEGKFACSAQGSSGNRITFRGYPGAAATFTSQEWPILDGYIHTTLAVGIGTATCSATNIILTDGTDIPDEAEILIDEEWIKIHNKASTHVIDQCTRNWSVGNPGGLASHSAGADVILNGNQIDSFGDFVTYRDFQITNSWPAREWPTLFKGRGEGIFNFASETEFINLILDNCQEGLYQQDGSCNTVTHGCIMHSNGNVDADRGHGHSAYLHNSGVGCVANYKNLIMFNSFGFGVHAYASSVQIINMNFDQIISFNAGVPALYPGSPTGANNLWSTCLIGDNHGSLGPKDCTLTNSYFWQEPGTVVSGGEIQIGISGGLGDGMTVTNNYAVGGSPVVSMTYFTNVDLHDNTFINGNTSTGNSSVYGPVQIDTTHTYDWDNNDIWDMRDLQSGYRSSFTIKSGDQDHAIPATIPGCCADHRGAGNAFGATTQFRSDTTLAAAITSTATCDGGSNRIQLVSSANILTSNVIKIDGERINVNNISGNDITSCTRGYDGTTAATHSIGAQVGMIYYAGSGSPTCTDGSCNDPKGAGWVNWSGGLDANSTYHAGALPTTTVMECFANDYEVGRGHCIVINWAETSTVSLDLSGLGFDDGDEYAVWDVQNFIPWTTASAIKTGTYSAGAPTITAVPFSALTTVIPPIGSAMTPDHTAQAADAKMATYIVRRTAVSGAPTPDDPVFGQDIAARSMRRRQASKPEPQGLSALSMPPPEAPPSPPGPDTLMGQVLT